MLEINRILAFCSQGSTQWDFSVCVCMRSVVVGLHGKCQAG